MIQVRDKEFHIYIEKDIIQIEVRRMAETLLVRYAALNPYFVCVLNGAFMFFGDLMKHFSAPSELGFIKATSYLGMSPGTEVRFDTAGQLELTGRHVLIIEDIVDTGNTLKALHAYLGKLEPESLGVCTLLFKKEAYQQSLPIDYVCFETENRFLLGYGLDYNGYGRNLPEIYILNE